VLFDQIEKLEVFYILKDYPEKLRKIMYYDEETGKTLVFLPNNIDLPAHEIALLYKYVGKLSCFQMDKTASED